MPEPNDRGQEHLQQHEEQYDRLVQGVNDLEQNGFIRHWQLVEEAEALRTLEAVDPADTAKCQAAVVHFQFVRRFRKHIEQTRQVQAFIKQRLAEITDQQAVEAKLREGLRDEEL